ncbi:IS66 family transposase [Bathymodiolus japonicus methanotrophic gill symbiont]|uniref:IS66 family transposase n=1 Tax=Bathymodiolus japonicus methanotrophic gill symbiont TaxID=113269 RepID=UPI001C8F1D6A|nr:transposase [Bathymodiolus japonicus methanotrophic gill symbiont]
MWLYQSGGHESEHPIVLHDYQSTWAGAHAESFLRAFSGHLQVDGYAGYHALASDDCILVGCMAHARRKFDEALKLDVQVFDIEKVKSGILRLL